MQQITEDDIKSYLDAVESFKAIQGVAQVVVKQYVREAWNLPRQTFSLG